MQIENFKIFADLVETKSFSKSAKLNGLTQSAVSQQSRAMERELKALLIDRSQKQFQLTREGQVLYDSSKEILNQYDKMLSELQELKKVVSGTIRISSIYTIGLHEVQPYVKRFLQEFPKVKVQVEYRRSNQVYDDIQHNVVDIGLVAYPAKARMIDVLPFRSDDLVLITSPAHPLAKFCSVDIGSLAGEKFIGFDPDMPTRKGVDEVFRSHGFEVSTTSEYDNIETLKRAVEIGNGIAVVPRASVVQESKQGSLSIVSFKGQAVTRPLGILVRKGRVLAPAIKKFIDILKMEMPDETNAQAPSDQRAAV